MDKNITEFNETTKQKIKEKVLCDIYIGLILLIIPLSIISRFRFSKLDREDLFFITLAFPILLGFIHIFRNRVNFFIRTWALIIILFIAGILAYLQLGVISIGLILLFSSGIVSVMLLSKKLAFITLNCIGISLAIIAYLSTQRYTIYNLDLRDVLHHKETWNVQILGYVLVVIIVARGLRRLVDYNESFIMTLQDKNKEIINKYNEIADKDKELLAKEERITTTQIKADNSEAMYQTLFNSLDDLVYAMDLEGNFEVVNDNFLKTLNTSEEAVLGKSVYEVFKGSTIDTQWESIREKVLSTGEKDVQYNTFRDSSDKIRTYEVTLLPIFVDGEITKLMGTSRDITQLIVQEETIQRLSYSDHLTGLKNRIAFRDFIEDKIKNYTIGTYPFSLCIIDVDDFKTINNKIGHLQGDELIIDLSKRLNNTFKDALLLSRIGGDEFVLVHELKDPSNDIKNIIKRINSVTEYNFIIDAESYSISLSSGFSIYPYNGKSYDELFSNADSALLASKKLGFNQHTVYEATK